MTMTITKVVATSDTKPDHDRSRRASGCGAKDAVGVTLLMPLHPEHAERRAFGDGGIEAGGEGEAEHVAGLRGVDDAVVPQPRGGVPRIALRLIIVAHRLLEGFGLLRRPLGGVAVDGRQHACRLLA